MDNFTTDYVYFDENTNDFKNINIKINIVKNQFLISITSEDTLDDICILDILRQFENNFTRKMRISLVDECEIFVEDKIGKRKIELEYGDFFIKKSIKQS